MYSVFIFCGHHKLMNIIHSVRKKAPLFGGAMGVATSPCQDQPLQSNKTFLPLIIANIAGGLTLVVLK